MYEQGMKLNPAHAPLYHSLAELEARIFNVEGLARLNKRAVKIFNRNALEPAHPSSSAAHSARARNRSKPHLPGSIAILAERIVNEEDNPQAPRTTSSSATDPSKTLENISDNLIEGLLEDL